MRHDLSVKSASSDARRTTTFSNGDLARLVLFRDKSGTRLAWHLTYRATSQAVYDAVVDATSGAILRRANLVKNIDVSVFENYPGAPPAARSTRVDLDALPDEHDDPQRTVRAHLPRRQRRQRARSGRGGHPRHVRRSSPFTGAVGAELASASRSTPCAWDPGTCATRGQTNMNEEAVQAHYYVSKFHDHLLAAPIGFDAGDGNFEGDDRVEVNADDGAGTPAGSRRARRRPHRQREHGARRPTAARR